MSLLLPRHHENPPCPECGGTQTFRHTDPERRSGLFTCRECGELYEWRDPAEEWGAGRARRSPTLNSEVTSAAEAG